MRTTISELVKAFGILIKAELAMSPLKVKFSGLENYLGQLEVIEKIGVKEIFKS